MRDLRFAICDWTALVQSQITNRSCPGRLRCQQPDPGSAELDRFTVFVASFVPGLRIVRLRVGAAPPCVDNDLAVAGKLDGRAVLAAEAAVKEIFALGEDHLDAGVRYHVLVVI